MKKKHTITKRKRKRERKERRKGEKKKEIKKVRFKRILLFLVLSFFL